MQIFFLLLALTAPVLAAIRTERLGADLAMWDTAARPNGKIMLTIQGTGGSADSLTLVQQEAARAGYQVIAIDYPNQVITTTCRPSADPLCFDHFREEIATGHDVSAITEVTVAQSLERRLEAHLRALSRRWPLRFGRFRYLWGSPAWHLFTLMGHSQGSGHAAYLAKRHRVDAVLMAAGPQDVFADGRPAPWLSVPGATPPARHFALLHFRDYFGVHYQRAALNALRVPLTQQQVSWRRTADPHNDIVGPSYRQEWQRLFARLNLPQ